MSQKKQPMDLLAMVRAKAGKPEVKTETKPKIEMKTKPNPQPKIVNPKSAPEPKVISLKDQPKIDLTSKPKIDLTATKITSLSSESAKISAVKKESGEITWIMGLGGRQGTGKTKRAMDLVKLLKGNERMLYLDSEFKSDKMKAEWHPDSPIDIKNFLQVDAITYDTLEIKSIDEFRNIFQTEWKPLLESGNYKLCVVDKANPFWPWSVDYWKKLNPKRNKPLPHDYGEVYNIALKKVFNPLINCCRINGINLVFCYNIKGKYREGTEVGKQQNVHEAILGQLDFEFWFEFDYEVFCLKNTIKAFWTTVDEDVNFADYFNNREFILGDNIEVSGILREFKRYEDFKEDTLLSSLKRIEKKKTINLLKQTE